MDPLLHHFHMDYENDLLLFLTIVVAHLNALTIAVLLLLFSLLGIEGIVSGVGYAIVLPAQHGHLAM